MQSQVHMHALTIESMYQCLFQALVHQDHTMLLMLLYKAIRDNKVEIRNEDNKRVQ
jgi:hypothetical protein